MFYSWYKWFVPLALRDRNRRWVQVAGCFEEVGLREIRALPYLTAVTGIK